MYTRICINVDMHCAMVVKVQGRVEKICSLYYVNIVLFSYLFFIFHMIPMYLNFISATELRNSDVRGGKIVIVEKYVFFHGDLWPMIRLVVALCTMVFDVCF